MAQDILESTHTNLISNHIPIDTPFQFQILTQPYIEQVTELFTRAFCRSEPMTEYLRMDESLYRVFAGAVTEKACEDNLSIIALDKSKVVAIALVEDMALPGKIPDFDPKFIYILSLLDKLGHPFFADKEFLPGNIAHLFITAVDDNYRKKGLSTQVNFRAMDLALQNGFDYMYCELTNYFNEKGLIPHLKNSKELIGSCFYQDFIYENQKPFAHLPGGATAYLWAIKENAQLRYKNNK